MPLGKAKDCLKCRVISACEISPDCNSRIGSEYIAAKYTRHLNCEKNLTVSGNAEPISSTFRRRRGSIRFSKAGNNRLCWDPCMNDSAGGKLAPAAVETMLFNLPLFFYRAAACVLPWNTWGPLNPQLSRYRSTNYHSEYKQHPLCPYLTL